ncbi:MAG TPA: autoinducer 2 import system permease LsrD [Anaerolineales bacterium]
MKTPKFFRSWEVVLVAVLAMEIAAIGVINPAFLNIENLLYSTNDFAHITLAALPLTLVMITSGIDISVSSTMGLTSITLGLLWKVGGVNIFLAMFIAILVGILAGVINGLIVANTNINPLVVTLGTLFLYAGIATGLSRSMVASSYEGISGLPESFSNLTHDSLGLVPYTLLFILLFSGFLYIILHHTRFGRSIYLVGVNPEAARYSGIPVKKVLVGAYALSGLGAALGGVMLTSYFTSARADLGGGALLSIITVVVLGGTSNMGGTGTIIGTLLASLAVGILKQGLLALGITTDVSQVVIGALLVGIVASKAGVTALSQYRMNRLVLRDRNKGKEVAAQES